jgi:hypothetical protein
VRATTKMAAKELQHYDRDGECFRQSTFLEFRRRVEGKGSERQWWEPARESVAALQNQQLAVTPLMTALRKLALALSPVTKMETKLATERDLGGGQDTRHEVCTAGATSAPRRP